MDINDGAMVLTAVNQPIYISNATYTGWLPDPRNLTTDDSIFDAVTNTWVRVYALRFLDKQTKVYDVVTTGPNNFIANGFLLDRKLQ